MAAGENAVFEIAKLFGIAGKIHTNISNLQLTCALSTSNEESNNAYTPLPSVVETTSCYIEKSAFCEGRDCSVLVLFMSSNYFVVRVQQDGCQPIVKQIHWFLDRPNTILDMVLDPSGEWLSCAVLDSSVHLVPLAPLLLNRPPTIQYGSMDDVEVIQPSKKYAPPTCMVWWESLEHINYIITGSERGELVLFDLIHRTEKLIGSCGIECVDSMQIITNGNQSVSLIICLRGFRWLCLQLEELVQAPLTASTSQAVVMAAGVVASLAHRTGEDGLRFSPYELRFSDKYRLMVLKREGKEDCLGAHNLQTNQMEIYSAELQLAHSLFAYIVPPCSNDVLVVGKVMYALCHDDEEEEVHLKVLSERRCRTGIESPTAVSHDRMQKAILMTQNFSNDNIIKGFYPISSRWNDAIEGEWSFPGTPLDGCVIVTDKCVYHLRQRQWAESVFVRHALTPSGLMAANDVAILFDLDVHELYKVVAEQKLAEGQHREALEVYLHSMCNANDVIDGLLRKHCYEEALIYIDHVLDDYSKRARSDRKWLYRVLLYCYIHQVLAYQEDKEKLRGLERMRQRLVDDFHLESDTVLKTFLSHGLLEEMMEYAKAKGLVGDALSLMLESGCLATANQMSGSLATSQYVNILSTVAKGHYLQMMPIKNLLKLIKLKPSIILGLEGHLRLSLPSADLDLLLKWAELLDPSHSTIRPLLQRGLAQPRQRSGSTGSLVSMVSSLSSASNEEQPPVHMPALLELFLCALLYLRWRRGRGERGGKSLDACSGGPGGGAYQGVLSCGGSHTALVDRTSSGLSTWGERSHGKLGHDEMELTGCQYTPLPVNLLVELGVQVTAVSCGGEHTVILSQQGVYSWGSNSYGQLGHGDTNPRFQPVLVSGLVGQTVLQVATGYGHCLAITDGNRVWGWGHNEHGQLGLGHRHEDKTTPTHITLLDDHKIVTVSGGNRHSAALSKDGKLFTFGSSSYGQLGHGDHVTCAEPTQVRFLGDQPFVDLVSCGCHHTLVHTKRRILFVFGKNFFGEEQLLKGFFQYKSGRLGNRSTSQLSSSDFLVPTALPESDILGEVVQISSGSTHSLLLTRGGGVYSWGCSAHGQLGLPGVQEQAYCRRVPGLGAGLRVVGVACGQDHSSGLDEAGQLWVWGRADCGQLGLDMAACMQAAARDPAHFNGQFRGAMLVRVFTPVRIKMADVRLATPPSQGSSSEDGKEAESGENSVEMEWNLPNLKSVGVLSYDDEALVVAMTKLHGYYRSGPLVQCCHDCEDWTMLSHFYQMEKQWPQALEFGFRSLPPQADIAEHSALVKRILTLFFKETVNFDSEEAVHAAGMLFRTSILHWSTKGLPYTVLEGMFSPHVGLIAQPIFDVLSSSTEGQQLSMKFQMTVGHCMMENTQKGQPLGMAGENPLHGSSPKALARAMSVGGSGGVAGGGDKKDGGGRVQNVDKMSTTLRHNLAKDLLRSARSITLAEQSPHLNDRKTEGVVSFTCGHAYSSSELPGVLFEFDGRVGQDLPGAPNPALQASLGGLYQESPALHAACPLCVYQQLRKMKLAQNTRTAIRPWATLH